MKVIGAGFGRTGTLSLKHALETLGFKPCYHVVEIFEHPEHINHWRAVSAGNEINWETIFSSYEATTDIPACLYYKELMATYPEAKVLLSVRDPERWYESMFGTVYQLRLLPTWIRWMPKMGDFLKLVDTMIWEAFFGDNFADKAAAMKRFIDHNNEVKQVVPSEKLLVYSVKEGWEPLCAFLNVPIPNEPFPHLNDRAEMQQRVQRLQLIGYGVPLLLLSTLGLITGWLIKRR